MEDMVKKYLSEAGYSEDQITSGIDYAAGIGYSSADELGQLALTRILYSDAQIEGGDLAGWEPMDWSDYE